MISMYSASVPVFLQMLGSLDDLLVKAQSHAEEHGIDSDELLQSRLAPDMFPLARQVQVACDFARSVPARLVGIEVPTYEETEQTFVQLRARIARTLAFIDGLAPSDFLGSEEREIVLRPGTPKARTIRGEAYLLHYGLPQFFFHVTTAYALLRHHGVPIGKKDYMGIY
jgi:hypothetical protein